MSRANPFIGYIKERRLLNGAGSTKSTYHIVVDTAHLNLPYTPGDSLAILPENDPDAVAEHLTRLNLLDNPDARHHLTFRANLARPADDYKKFGPLLPRFYSIASSPTLYPHEIHLLVAHLEHGVATSFLCKRAHLHTTPIPLYIQPAHSFRLPANPATPLILIGPGTGVAPYRAFIHERLAQKATGAHWLFFGERNRATDFYYADEWEPLVSAGQLRLELAFSRDSEPKTYVQHRLYHNRHEIYEWLTQGAHIYVCGDAKHMARDVEATLRQIFQEVGNHTEDSARAYLKQLRIDKRYLTDVY